MKMMKILLIDNWIFSVDLYIYICAYLECILFCHEKRIFILFRSEHFYGDCLDLLDFCCFFLFNEKTGFFFFDYFHFRLLEIREEINNF
jgi:hypothetical protein